MIDFKKYEMIAAKLTTASNALWNNVTLITVAEILAKEVDLHELDKKCWDLKTINSNSVRALSNDINAIPEDEYFEKYEDLHNATEALLYVSDGKLDAVDSIISELRKIEDTAEENNFLDKFKDIQQINLHESIIRLERISIR